jgi:hypothetical protein
MLWSKFFCAGLLTALRILGDQAGPLKNLDDCQNSCDFVARQTKFVDRFLECQPGWRPNYSLFRHGFPRQRQMTLLGLASIGCGIQLTG